MKGIERILKAQLLGRELGLYHRAFRISRERRYPDRIKQLRNRKRLRNCGHYLRVDGRVSRLLENDFRISGAIGLNLLSYERPALPHRIRWIYEYNHIAPFRLAVSINEFVDKNIVPY